LKLGCGVLFLDTLIKLLKIRFCEENTWICYSSSKGFLGKKFWNSIPFSRLQRQRIRRKEVSVETNIERATTKTKNRAQKFVFIFLFLFIYPNIQRPKKKVQKKDTNIDVK
jgi:hypothetical protein